MDWAFWALRKTSFFVTAKSCEFIWNQLFDPGDPQQVLKNQIKQLDEEIHFLRQYIYACQQEDVEHEEYVLIHAFLTNAFSTNAFMNGMKICKQHK